MDFVLFLLVPLLLLLRVCVCVCVCVRVMCVCISVSVRARARACVTVRVRACVQLSKKLRVYDLRCRLRVKYQATINDLPCWFILAALTLPHYLQSVREAARYAISLATCTPYTTTLPQQNLPASATHTAPSAALTRLMQRGLAGPTNTDSIPQSKPGIKPSFRQPRIDRQNMAARAKLNTGSNFESALGAKSFAQVNQERIHS